MTVFYNSFGADTINAAPSGFSFLQNWPKKVTPDTFQVKADANSLVSGKQLYLNTADTDGLGAAVYTTAGLFNDGEFLAVLIGGSYNFIKLGFNISDANTSANIVHLEDNGGNVRAKAQYTTNGINAYFTDSTLGDKTASGVNFSNPFCVRVKKTGQNIKVKVWQFGVAEPATWLMDYTDIDMIDQTGYFGLLYDSREGSVFFANSFYMPYFSVATTSGESAVLPPKLLKGGANLNVNGGGKLTPWKMMKGQAGLIVNANLKTANPIYLKATAGLIINARGKARVNWRLKGSVGLQVQATGGNEQLKKLKASAILTTNTQGKLTQIKFLKGQANPTINGYGELHGKKIRFVGGLRANLTVNFNSKLASKFIAGASVKLQVNAKANLAINRFVSPFPPNLYIFNYGQLNAVFGKGPSACRYYNPEHLEQIFNADTVANSQTENSFKFTVGKHEDIKYLRIGTEVVFRDLDNNFQVFEVANIHESHGANYEMEVTCNHQFIELGDDYIEPKQTFTNYTVGQAVNYMLSNSRWKLGTVDAAVTNQTHQFTLGRQYALKGLAHIVTVAKCELVFRVDVVGQTITNRWIDVVAARGTDTGKRFVYGKDTTRISKEVDDSELKTAVYAFGKYDDTTDTYVNIGGVEWRGAPYDSYPAIKPINDKWIGDNEAKNAYGRAGRHRFGEYYNDEITDPNILIQAAWDYLQTVNGPLVGYEVDAIELERISGFKHEKVRMGDFVGIIDAEFTPELRVKARVLQINRNLKNPEKTRFLIGNYIPSVITRVG